MATQARGYSTYEKLEDEKKKRILYVREVGRREEEEDTLRPNTKLTD
jgi:hypothetical protein